MGISHVQISFFHRLHSWKIDYYAFGMEELQDAWRLRMDPLCDPLRPTGTTYQIDQIPSQGGDTIGL